MTRIWLSILVMIIVTYLVRVLPLTLIRKQIKNRFLNLSSHDLPRHGAGNGLTRFRLAGLCCRRPGCSVQGKSIPGCLLMLHHRLHLRPVPIGSELKMVKKAWPNPLT